MRLKKRKPGFALATTVVLMLVSSISLTTLLLMLSQTLSLTRNHTESMRAFYAAEAGKNYAMWKISPVNTGTDADHLADCLAKNTNCPNGLNESWTQTIPTDTFSGFTVRALSTANTGEATITSNGARGEGTTVARRQTKITAFKPTRQIQQNDEAYAYSILTDTGLGVFSTGDLRINHADGQNAAKIHSNDSMYTMFGNLVTDGPITTARDIWMPLIQSPQLTFVTAPSVRARTCGWSGCNAVYNQQPQYCWGTGCDGFEDNIPLPGIDINSNRADSYKNLVFELERQNPNQKYTYNPAELRKMLDDAHDKNLNGGWVDLPGPITYVNGSIDVSFTTKLRVHGVLVVQGNMDVGWAGRAPYWNCTYPSCQPNVYFQVLSTGVDGAPMVPGLIVSGQLSFANYLKDVSIEGLIYAQNGFTVSCTYENPVRTRGIIIARFYANNGGSCNKNLATVGQHLHTYDATNAQLLFQGPRAVTNLVTSFTGHWEEEY